MKLKTSLLYLEDCIVEGYKDSSLCVEDKNGTLYQIQNYKAEKNGDITLYTGSKGNAYIKTVLEQLRKYPQDSKVYVQLYKNESNTKYNIEGEYIVDKNKNVCFDIRPCHNDSEYTTIIQQANKIVQQAPEDQEELEKYEKEYKENTEKLDSTLSSFGARLGVKTVYMVLWLYYALNIVPPQYKAAIWGALGYLISPFDLISDLIPFLGLSDDVAVITAVFIATSKVISELDYDKVSEMAKDKLRTIFPNLNESDLD